MTEVDWEFAYNEVLKIEELKKDKQTMEAEKKLSEEKIRIQEEMRIKYEDEKEKSIQKVQKEMEEK